MHILHLVSSPRGTQSFSVQLGNAVVEQLQAAHPTSTVQVHDLTKQPFPHLEEAHLQYFNTPLDQRTPDQLAAMRHSDEAVAELLAADTIVIGTPFYNFSISSTLKTWIDHVVRPHVTFTYSAAGQEGLVKGKKVYLVIAYGGVYSEGPLVEADFALPYLKYMLGFIGLTDVTVVRVEGTGLPDTQATALATAISCITL